MKRFWIGIFVLFLTFFVLLFPSVSYANTVDRSDAEVTSCFDGLNDPIGGFYYCDQAIHKNESKSVLACLSDQTKVSIQNNVWKCDKTKMQDVAGEVISVEDTEACAQEFAQSVCINVKINQFGNGCSQECVNNNLGLFVDLFTSKRNQITTCPRVYNNEVSSVSNGAYDAAITDQCSWENKNYCLNQISSEIKGKIDSQYHCEDYTLSQAEKDKLAAAFNTRFESLVEKPPEEVVAARSTVRTILDSCQRDDGGNYYNNIRTFTCHEYYLCLVDELRKIDATNVLWSCNSTTIACETNFLKYLSQAYLNWADHLPDVNKFPDPAGGQKNCTDKNFYENAKYIAGRIEKYEQVYREKMEERKKLIDNGTEVNSTTQDLWATINLDDNGLTQAFEVLDCGFANAPMKSVENASSQSALSSQVQNKRKCCKNEVDDLSIKDPTSSLPATCFLPKPWGLSEDDKCFVDSTLFTSFIFGKINESLGKQGEGLKNFMKENGSVPPCFIGEPSDIGNLDNCTCVMPDGAQMCRRYIAGKDTLSTTEEEQALVASRSFAACVQCMGSNGQNSDGNQVMKMYTAFGCIDTSVAGIAEYIFSIGLGLAGTIALGCIIFASIKLQVSAGNPEKIKESQELITSCITGLILVIFSIVLLRIIGIDILRIPGFN